MKIEYSLSAVNPAESWISKIRPLVLLVKNGTALWSAEIKLPLEYGCLMSSKFCSVVKELTVTLLAKYVSHSATNSNSKVGTNTFSKTYSPSAPETAVKFVPGIETVAPLTKPAAEIILPLKVKNLVSTQEYSIVAETYYNFGYIGGILFTIVLGYFFSTFFNITSKDNNN